MDKTPLLYKNSDASFLFANYFNAMAASYCPIPPAEEEVFHTSWIFMHGAPNDKATQKISTALKSFFVFHNNPTPRFILWTNDVQQFFNSFTEVAPYIDVRKYDPVKESKGTPLAGRMSEDNLRKNDERNYAGGDLLRLLVTYKYGGFYFDIDSAFLKNVMPLFSREFVYKWSCYSNSNGAALRVKKESAIGHALLERLIARQDLSPGGLAWGAELYNEVLGKSDLLSLPAPWFDPNWLTNDGCDDRRGIFFSTPVNLVFNTKYKGPIPVGEYYFLNLGYMFHWHNQWDVTIEKGSPFSHIMGYINDGFVKVKPSLPKMNNGAAA